MATNPPITIGSLANVPAPGSAVNSAYHQSIANRVVHRFADVATRNTQWPAATAGPGAVCITLDTGTLWQVVGAAWVRAGAGQAAFFQAPATDQTGIGAAAVSLSMAATFAAIAGHRYKITVVLLTNVSTNTLRRFFIDRDGTQIFIGLFTLAGGFQTIVYQAYDSPAAGSHTYSLRALSDTGTVTISHSLQPGTLLVEDVGA